MTSNNSGQFQIYQDVLAYCSESYGSWELPISEIAIIGEYTNENGPFADDYFLVFLTDNKPGWLEGSFYADGRDSMLEELSKSFHTGISCGLAHSTTFASRILWPHAKKGHALFDFQPGGRFQMHQKQKP